MWGLTASSINDQITVSADFQKWFGEHALNIAVILIIAWLLGRFGTALINKIVQRTVRGDMYPTETDRKKRADTLKSLVSVSVRVGVWILASIMIVDELGVNTAPLLASAGVLGVALGFGAQSLIKDFVSGIFIIIENQYRVGDIVQLGEISGEVKAITIRTTVVRDLDGDLHHIPNGTIGITTNKTADFGNINENIIVGYDTDMDQLEHIVNHVGQEMAGAPDLKHKIKKQPRFGQIEGFRHDGVEVKIVGQTTPSDQWEIKSELYKRLHKAFDKHGIDIPYPQVVIHQAKKNN